MVAAVSELPAVRQQLTNKAAVPPLSLRRSRLIIMELNSSKYDFIELRTRAEFLDLCGDSGRADELRELSVEVGREVDLNCYAYQLLWRGQIGSAFELLHRNAELHPDSWNVYDSLAEAYAMIGDSEGAIDQYGRALWLVRDPEQKRRIRELLLDLRGVASV
jgi:tetratricopeptide (TPR) repeat protein